MSFLYTTALLHVKSTYDEMFNPSNNKCQVTPGYSPCWRAKLPPENRVVCQYGWTRTDLTPSGELFDFASCQIVPHGLPINILRRFMLPGGKTAFLPIDSELLGQPQQCAENRQRHSCTEPSFLPFSGNSSYGEGIILWVDRGPCTACTDSGPHYYSTLLVSHLSMNQVCSDSVGAQHAESSV